MLRAITTEWEERVRPILEGDVGRLPGALLEEKEFALAWHYRGADPERAARRSRELLGDLAGVTRNIGVQVLEGNKVLEVRHPGVNKGTAASEWLGTVGADFVLAGMFDFEAAEDVKVLKETLAGVAERARPWRA